MSHSFNTVIETERLILRPFTEADIQPSFELDSDPEVTRYTGDGGSKTLEKIEYLIKEVVLRDYELYGHGRFAVDWKETGEFIGFSGLKYLPETKEIDLGYRFKRTFWGKGIATESGWASLDFGFNQLNADRIVATALPGNKGSFRVMEKLGFTFEKEYEEDGMAVVQYQLARSDYHPPDN